MRRLGSAVLLVLICGWGCDPRPVRTSAQTRPAAARSTAPSEQVEAVADPPAPAEPACAEVAGLWACPSAEALAEWAGTHHVLEPAEATLAAALEPTDPVVIRDGLALYEELLAGPVRRTRAYLELWAHTPTFSDAELAEFAADPELWAKVVEFRSAAPSRQQSLIAAAMRAKDRRLLRAMLLRRGVFYLEDAGTAVYAAKRVTLGHLFDDPQIELRRGGQTYLLTRDVKGVYLHLEPVLDAVRGNLYLLDQVGLPGALPEVPGYDLQALRREHGLANVVVGAETAQGRPATVRFFSGVRVEGRLALDASGTRRLGVVAEPETLAALRAENVADRQLICNLLNTADLMAREDLPFDEPKVEIGQQDGYLRWRFAKAHAAGKTTYVMNGVTYQVYGKDGKPIVPQLCIDFITDAVDRFHGTWWEAEGEPRKPREFSIRDYMPFRTVRSLLEVARSETRVASVESLPAAEQVPYEEQDAFFDNLWRWRERVRVGDVVVIYGLRSDNQNHYHSFYIRETDPIHGVPVVLVANAGHAHDHSWYDVMWESPKRSIRHFVRWNPDWLRSPRAVDLADAIVARAKMVGRSD